MASLILPLGMPISSGCIMHSIIVPQLSRMKLGSWHTRSKLAK